MPTGIYIRTSKQYINRKGRIYGYKFPKGHIPWNRGTKGKGICKSNNGSFKKGNPGPWLGKSRSPFSEECRRKMSEAHKGEKAPAWKGGVTPINHIIRGSLEYKLWREAVFRRDNWTCKFCGKKGGKLNADHIKSFASYPELRFAIDNGRTLCVPCHKKTPTYLKNPWKTKK